VNIKDYISSGIIESYVLGLASPAERVEFEELCRQYPELVTARTEFELVLEKQLLAHAPASPAVNEKLMDAIVRGETSNDAKIVSMDTTTTTTRNSSASRWVAAASVILLLGAAYFAYDFYNKNKNLEDSNKELQSKVEKMEGAQKQMDEMQKMMSNPNVAVVNLVGTTPAKASADVYWDTTQSIKDVYLVIKNMPKIPNEKQYQLWSIINGPGGELQPESMGLFDVGTDGKVILKMSNTKKADAFAITIEARGNSGGPDLSQLQSMGKTRL
jgi:hypothetical protein